MISVRYLPGYPGFNAEAGAPLVGMLVLGAGLLILFRVVQMRRRRG